jgi:hypothetical protein
MKTICMNVTLARSRKIHIAKLKDRTERETEITKFRKKGTMNWLLFRNLTCYYLASDVR